ncbi:MAG: type II secretion system F family protein, partial [Planctomycetes bacterium]|nr:type II secretion system F family protein [Planctomycetota bacterium]
GQLRKKGLNVVDLVEAGPELSLWETLNKKPIAAKTADLALFTRQLATMLGAGIPLLEGIEILADQTATVNPGFGRGLQEVADAVRSGTGLSESMEKYPKVFPDIYINMVKAGEASGQLDSILDRLAEYMESSEALRAEIKSAMTYPVVSLCMVLGITGYLLVSVVPKFESMFQQLGGELPTVTVVVLELSRWLQANGMVVGGTSVAVVVAYKLINKNPNGAIAIDNVKLKLPVFGPLGQKVMVGRFARTFSTLLASGVPILGALEIVANTAGNKVLEKALIETRDVVRNGESISSHLGECWVFPPMVVKMIGIGERSGALEQLLSKVADFYDAEVETMVKSLTSLIEPFMIGTMGILVGTIVLAIFLPILEAQKSLTAGAS